MLIMMVLVVVMMMMMMKCAYISQKNSGVQNARCLSLSKVKMIMIITKTTMMMMQRICI